MAQATIGSLNVILGMDAGDFNRAVRDVEGSMTRLSAKLGAVAGVAAAFGAGLVQALGGAMQAVGAAFKKAIDDADAMDELAQKLGLTVEALTRIKYAAEISGVPIETLTQGVTKLSDALGDIAGGNDKSDPARTLQALGISAMEVGGQLKSMDTVLIEIAEKFASFEDSTQKTALAINLFGKSGAQLIPFLNQGRAGIAELTAEADRLGITLSSKAAGAAGKFNESIDKIITAVGVFFKELSQNVMPTLQILADNILENDRVFRIAKVSADALAFAFRAIASVVIGFTTAVQNATTRLLAFNSAAASALTLDFTQAGETWSKAMEEVKRNSEEGAASINKVWGAMQGQGGGELDTSGMMAGIDGLGGEKGQAPIVTSTQALAEANKAAAETQAAHNTELANYNALRAEGKRLFEETLDPVAKLSVELERVNELNRKGALLAHEHAAIQQRLAMQTLNAYAGMASGIAGNLSKVFGDSKAFAIAQAIINTAESVTKTLATYGFTPWGIAAASAAAAAGLAEVATIRSSGKGGGGGSSGSNLSSSSAAASGGASGGGAPAQQQGVYINLHGSRFSRDEVVGLIEQINEASRDGAKVMVQAA